MNVTEQKDHDLEQRLGKLRPAPLSSAQVDRLLAALPRPANRRSRTRLVWIWVPLAAAAALAIAFLLPGMLHRPGPPEIARSAPPPSPAAPLELVSSENQLVQTRDEGIWQHPDGQPYRILRCLTLKRSTWRNPEDGKEVELVWPGQRVLLLAANVQ
jgi:hypothetical protein